MSHLVLHRLPAVWLNSVGKEFPLPRVPLTWCPHAPHDVVAVIDTRIWTLGLDLLVAGLETPAGMGDVFVARVPDSDLVDVVLDNGRQRGALQVHVDDLTDFVTAVLLRTAPASQETP